jgi:hypothetical protein
LGAGPGLYFVFSRFSFQVPNPTASVDCADALVVAIAKAARANPRIALRSIARMEILPFCIYRDASLLARQVPEKRVGDRVTD